MMIYKSAISILFCLVICLCSIRSGKKVYSNEQLENEIKKVISSGADELRINELTDFKWDSLLILAPYTWIDDCEERFGVNCSPIEHSGIQSLDDRCVLIFLRNGSICEMVESIRYPGDFVPSASIFFTPEEAIFRVVDTEQQIESGENWIELIQINIKNP